MEATIIGGGRIGRGFVASLLQRNSIDKTFMDISDELIEKFNNMSEYTVHILGNTKRDTIINDFKGYSIFDEEGLKKQLQKSNFIFTAVGGKNLASLGKKIGAGYRFLIEHNTICSFTIITCENWLSPAEDLKTSILEELTDSQKNIFLKNVDITQGVIRASGTSSPERQETENPLDTWMQDYWILPIDKSRIRNNPVPDWKYFDFDDNFGEMLAQKIYTNNTSVALVGYLGYLKGHKYVADAANDEEIEPIFKKCFEEVNEALIHSLDVSEESQKEFSRVAEDKYKDYKIVDYVSRIAREPLRKLASDDRFIGPAKMAQKAGVLPEAIALGAAAALYFDDPTDEEAVKLKKMREDKGVIYILDTICGLAHNNKLKQLILLSIDILKNEGWIKEGEING